MNNMQPSSSVIAVHHYKKRYIPHYDFAAKLADGLIDLN